MEEEQPVEDGIDEKVKNGEEKAEENGDDDENQTKTEEKTEGVYNFVSIYGVYFLFTFCSKLFSIFEP